MAVISLAAVFKIVGLGLCLQKSLHSCFSELWGDPGKARVLPESRSQGVVGVCRCPCALLHTPAGVFLQPSWEGSAGSFSYVRSSRNPQHLDLCDPHTRASAVAGRVSEATNEWIARRLGNKNGNRTTIHPGSNCSEVQATLM